MWMKKYLKSFISILLIIMLSLALCPAQLASANLKQNKDKDNHGKSNQKAKNYLVLIDQGNGTYLAYKDIAFVTAKDKIMVKAKPLAEALGLSYESTSGKLGKKGCVLSLGNKKNVYTKNLKTFYYYNNNKKHVKLAKYKQIEYQSYYAVHYATLSTLVNYNYFNTSKNKEYKNLGYQAVIVYSRYSKTKSLPDTKKVLNLGSYHEPEEKLTTVKLTPSIFSNQANGTAYFVEANYATPNSSEKLILDLSEVLNAFQTYGLPYDGVYGYGSCQKALTLQGIDKKGKVISEVKTTEGEFLVNFPGAVKLCIVGDKRNLHIDFTPVKPIVITAPSKLALAQISWLYPWDGFARQYFVLADYMTFSTENISFAYTLSRKMIDYGNTDSPDRSSSYQRLTLVFRGSWQDMTSYNRYIEFKKTKNIIENSLVSFQDTGSATLAINYEAELNNMIAYLISNGLNNYYPSKNFENKLIMKLNDGVTNSSYSYITVDPSSLDLNHFLDYYYHLHEMVHFYEAKQPHYGLRFAAWTDGNAITLTRKTLISLNKSTTDINGVDYFVSMYATDFSFLTQENKNNFESYYLNATGWQASVVGYYFTDFLQKYYGSDVIYKIMEKVYAAKIPTELGRNSSYDKQFTDCIKACTSPNVFQLFVETCVY